jgi:hypothetical protein
MCTNIKTGEIMWRERKMVRANALMVGTQPLLLDEDGSLHLVELSPKGLTVKSSFKVLENWRGRRHRLPARICFCVTGNRWLPRLEVTCSTTGLVGQPILAVRMGLRPTNRDESPVRGHGFSTSCVGFRLPPPFRRHLGALESAPAGKIARPTRTRTFRASWILRGELL